MNTEEKLNPEEISKRIVTGMGMVYDLFNELNVFFRSVLDALQSSDLDLLPIKRRFILPKPKTRRLTTAADDYVKMDMGFIAEIGGHNLLEPAALGLPVLTGTHVFNFAEIFKLLKDQQAVIQVHNEDELCQAWLKLLGDTAAAQAMGQRAKGVVLQNQGALEKHMQYVGKLL